MAERQRAREDRAEGQKMSFARFGDHDACRLAGEYPVVGYPIALRHRFVRDAFNTRCLGIQNHCIVELHDAFNTDSSERAILL